MRVSIHQLNVLKAVADKGGITLAANSLHMTQPAVSNIIKQLESYYQCKITEPVGKKICLTSAGEVLYDMAEKVQVLLNDTERAISRINGNLSGKIKLSVVSTAKYFVPRLLGAFKKEISNDIEVELKVCNRQQVIDRLNSNLDDFVVMSQPPEQKDIYIEDFYQDKLVVAVSKQNKWLYKSQVKLRDLANENWIIRESGSGTRIVMKKLFDKYHINPNITMELGNNESIKQMIIADMGISIVSLQSIEFELDASLIDVLPVEGFPLLHEWYLVSKSKKNVSTLAKLFLDYVRTHPHIAHFESWKTNLTDHS